MSKAKAVVVRLVDFDRRKHYGSWLVQVYSRQKIVQTPYTAVIQIEWAKVGPTVAKLLAKAHLEGQLQF